jgi:hypothetical protein
MHIENSIAYGDLGGYFGKKRELCMKNPVNFPWFPIPLEIAYFYAQDAAATPFFLTFELTKNRL